ncbi:MAG: pyrimidine dimer DNA glycosylase/endonuclease V [Ignavibacteriaceae bacterium]|jgi:hypothetical protein
MRIWSLHPKYLDTKGLVALWRETLLAKHVLEGKTKGYKNHPQLNRFKEAPAPLDCINQYLSVVYENALLRGFNFAKDKINLGFNSYTLTVTKGQLFYEKQHLLIKLITRDKAQYKVLLNETNFVPHPIFRVIEGEVEVWERI